LGENSTQGRAWQERSFAWGEGLVHPQEGGESVQLESPVLSGMRNAWDDLVFFRLKSSDTRPDNGEAWAAGRGRLNRAIRIRDAPGSAPAIRCGLSVRASSEKTAG